MVARTQPDLEDLDLHGGHPALDFVNTVDPRTGPLPHVDYLTDFEALCGWAVHISAIETSRAHELMEAGRAHPRRAATVWQRTIALREALHRILVAIVSSREPAAADLEVITAEHRAAQAHVDLLPPREGLVKGSAALRPALRDEAEPEAPLHLLAVAATELLTEADATRLRICPGDEDGCGWVVLDATRNRSRRWCDMGACGSSVKSSRLTERRRVARGKVDSGGSER